MGEEAGMPEGGREAAGLCATCRHARPVDTPRSHFWLCALSATDPSFARYPRLPVLECPGYQPGVSNR